MTSNPHQTSRSKPWCKTTILVLLGLLWMLATAYIVWGQEEMSQGGGVMVVGGVESVVLVEDGGTRSYALDDWFSGDGLSYEVSGGNGVVDAMVSDGRLIIGGAGAGSVMVTVTATDGSGGSGEVMFSVEVLESPGFTDTVGHTHEVGIARFVAEGITRGCNPPRNDRFCPDRSLTRGEMATIMVRKFGLTAGDDAGVSFTDTATSVHRSNIAIFAAEGITRGCNPPTNDRFCPNRVVTRGEFATFLVRVLGLEGSDTGGFTDTAGSVHRFNIGLIAREGITRGCNPPANTRFCPNRGLSRGEVATLLSRVGPSTPPPVFEPRPSSPPSPSGVIGAPPGPVNTAPPASNPGSSSPAQTTPTTNPSTTATVAPPPTTNPALPDLTISIAAPSGEVSEGSEAMFTVTISEPADVRFQVTWVADTESPNVVTEELENVSGFVTFDIGENLKPLPVPVRDDNWLEAAETFTVTLSEVIRLSGELTFNPVFGTKTVVGTIAASDPLTLEFRVPSTIPEGDEVRFQARLSGGRSLEEIPLSLTLSGNATAGEDYTTPSDLSFSIPAEAESGHLAVSTIDDQFDEEDKTITATLTSFDIEGVTLMGTGMISTTLQDNDLPPELSMAVSSNSLDEASTAQTVTLSVTLARSAYPRDRTVNLEFTGSAGSSDYTSSATSIAIPTNTLGEMADTVTITVSTDDTYEGSENIMVAATLDGETTAFATETITITDADRPSVSMYFDRSTLLTTEESFGICFGQGSSPSSEIADPLVSGDTPTSFTSGITMLRFLTPCYIELKVVLSTAALGNEGSIPIRVASSSEADNNDWWWRFSDVADTQPSFNTSAPNVSFAAGETEKNIQIALRGSGPEENLVLEFGDLPAQFTEGTPNQVTIRARNNQG